MGESVWWWPSFKKEAKLAKRISKKIAHLK